MSTTKRKTEKEGDDPCREDINRLQEAMVRKILHRCVDVGWKAKQLCQAAGVSRGHWSRIARMQCTPSLEVMVKLCRAVGLDLYLSFEKPTRFKMGDYRRLSSRPPTKDSSYVTVDRQQYAVWHSGYLLDYSGATPVVVNEEEARAADAALGRGEPVLLRSNGELIGRYLLAEGEEVQEHEGYPA